jgi:hypothetical protein
MDLGFFKRSRGHFAGWMILPLLMVVLACAFWWCASRKTHEVLKRRSAYLALLPAIDRKLETAHTLLRKYAIETEAGVGAVDALTAELQEAAAKQSFTINSISFKEIESEDEDPVSAWIGVVKGAGSLTSVVRFLSALHTQHRLMVVESTSLKDLGPVSGERYAGEFRFRFLELSLPEDVVLALNTERGDE